MSTATTTSTDTGQHTSTRGRQREAQQPVTQQERNAAQRLRTTMAAVRLSFTWLGVRKTLATEQRTTAARAFHADRELLSASKLILDTKNPAYRAVAAVRSEAAVRVDRLPPRGGQDVIDTIQPVSAIPSAPSEARYPRAGVPVGYVDPFLGVAEEDWESTR